MALDLVFPRGNEERLFETARKLGFSEIIFCYRLDDPLLKERKGEVSRLQSGDITPMFAVYVKTQQDVQKARKFTEHIVALGRREMFEDKRVKYIIGFESSKREDFVHHRNSGLTQVFLKNAIRTDKTLLVNISQLRESKAPHVMLGRMMQNNRLYRKYSPKVCVVSGAREPLEMRAPRDLENALEC